MTLSPSPTSTHSNTLAEQIKQIDDQLSNRPLKLDPAGYFVIYLDREQGLICATYFSVAVNEQGLATDPETGQVLPAKGKLDRKSEHLFTARTAKELCVEIFEQWQGAPVVSQFDHAAYLGREFQRAELALIHGSEYVQD